MKTTKSRIASILTNAGISPKNGGFDIIVEAIMLVLQDQSFSKRYVTKLYPELGSRFFKTPNAIERNIRFSIVDAYEKNPCFFIKIGIHNKPTNKEFIETVVSMIKYGNL